MLADYFAPVKDLEILTRDLGIHHLGATMDIHYRDFPSLKKGQLAIISFDKHFSHQQLRKHLYKLATHSKGTTIADLGYVKKTDHPQKTNREILCHLWTKGIFPIVLGGADNSEILDWFAGATAALPLKEISILDEQVRFEGDNNYLGLLMEANQHKTIRYNIVGCQAHYVPSIYHKVFPNQQLDLYGLGSSRKELSELEPLFRQSDLLQVHLSVLKQSEAPAVRSGSPSGFLCEELCQLSRYAGMSDRLKGLGVFGYYPTLDHAEQTAQVVAQLIWYFLDGYHNKMEAEPEGLKYMTKYLVFSKVLGDSIVFWKDRKSGRWWMQLKTTEAQPDEAPELIPCTIKDYSLACQEEIPDRLLKALQQ